MEQHDSEELTVLRLLAEGPKKAVYENDKIVFEDGTEVPQRVVGHLRNADPPLVTGTVRLSSEGGGVVGYVYQITDAGRRALDGEG